MDDSSAIGQSEARQGPAISHESLSPTTAGDESVRNDQNEQIDITGNDRIMKQITGNQ